MTDDERDFKSDKLRARAQARLGATLDEVAEMSPDEAKNLVYELQVHQEELNIANEELQNSHLALARARDRYEDLFEFAPVGYLILDEKRIVRRANATACAMLGYRRHEIEGAGLASFVTPDDRDACHIHLRNVTSEEARKLEFGFRRSDNTTIRVQLHTTKIGGGSEEGEEVRVALTDITVRSQLEDLLRQRADELSAANKELESFSYSVSHDLNAPLRTMRSFCGIIQEDYGEQLDEMGRMYLDRIDAAAGRMSDLIKDMLLLSRITRQELVRRDLNLYDIASEIISELRSLEPDRQVEIIMNRDLIVNADRRLIKVALSNLIGNAWKYTSKQENARIEIGAVETDKGREICVRDNGVGFDPRYSKDLFVPFRRLHSTGDFEGTGIGLAVVQRVIDKHGGQIRAESEPGEGSAFYFTLG